MELVVSDNTRFFPKHDTTKEDVKIYTTKVFAIL